MKLGGNIMEIKSFAFESKVNLEKNTFEGYASIAGNKDSHDDIIESGAFKKTLKEFAHRIKVLWQHDPYSPIGIPLQMNEDSKGLYVKAKISQTSIGKDALILMKDGVINELSIGYNAVKHMMDEETGIRHLQELKLWEFSPVTWASNDLATITGAKSNNQLEYMLRGINELKTGNGISSTNPKLVNEAIKALKALLNEDEPDNSTQIQNKEPLYKENEEINSILEEINQFRKSIGGM